MLWLIVTISSYFLFAIVALIDKYLLGGRIPSPKVYAFYVGILGIWALVLIPLGFLIPEPLIIVLSLFAGAIFIISLFAFFYTLSLFEASRVVPAIGGFLPLFAFVLTYLFSSGKETLSFPEIIAFLLLVLGSVIITWQRSKNISLKSLQISALAALLGALAFVLIKHVYLFQPFWSGLIWMRIGGFLGAGFFLFSKEVREEIFIKRISFKPKTAGIFLFDQLMGSGAGLLQNWAIFLAPLAYVAIITALQGVEYVFLLIFAVLLSLKFPKILKEKVSREILLQKIVAILLIGGGLTLLAI